MKLVLSEPRLLIEPISVISELVNEVQFKIDKDRLELISMDPANVAMIVFTMMSSAFSEYDVKKPVTISLGLDSFKAVLRRSKPSDAITLQLDEDKNRLKIQIVGESTRTFNLSLIDIEEKKQRVPDLTFPLKIQTNSSVFDEAITDMDIVSESVMLVCDKDKFCVEASGNLSDAKAEIGKDENTVIDCKSKEEVRSKYSIEYLKKMVKAGKLSPNLEIQFSKDYPLRMDYRIKDKLGLSFILAPRVSND